MSSNMSRINGCAFCLSNRKPWTGHTVEVCVELANCVCGYCKEKGHTPKKCPKSALKKQRDEEWAKRQEERKKKEEIKKRESETSGSQKKTWSSLFVKSLTTQECEAMEQQHRAIKEQEAEEKKKQYEEKKKKMISEKYYVRRMRNEYGIKPCDFAEAGDFWFFFVEGLKDDSNIAKVLRERLDSQHRFKCYLKEKYWVNWLSRTIGTEDDCLILERWRREKDKR
jgi:hypothetical protein